jgi:hypothetical protein
MEKKPALTWSNNMDTNVSMLSAANKIGATTSPTELGKVTSTRTCPQTTNTLSLKSHAPLRAYAVYNTTVTRQNNAMTSS